MSPMPLLKVAELLTTSRSLPQSHKDGTAAIGSTKEKGVEGSGLIRV